MPAQNSMDDALLTLAEKLQSLNDLVAANRFMVEAMVRESNALKRMDDASTKDMLRRRARAAYHPVTGSAPNAAVLAILEQVLGGRQQAAEIIPFPARS